MPANVHFVDFRYRIEAVTDQNQPSCNTERTNGVWHSLSSGGAFWKGTGVYKRAREIHRAAGGGLSPPPLGTGNQRKNNQPRVYKHLRAGVLESRA